MTAEFINDHIAPSNQPDDPNRLIRIRRGKANLGELTDHEERAAYHVLYRTASGNAEWILPIHAGMPAIRTVPGSDGQEYDQKVPSGLTVECLLAIVLDQLRMIQFDDGQVESNPREKIEGILEWLHKHPIGLAGYISPNPAPLEG